MKNVKAFLIIQSILCILLAVLLITAVIGIYCSGSAARTENPLAWIFSREITAGRFRTITPLFFASAVLTAAGLILGVKNENGLEPVKSGKVKNRALGGKTLRTVLLIAAVVLIVVGVFNGSARDVFGKAVRICTECVGLG